MPPYDNYNTNATTKVLATPFLAIRFMQRKGAQMWCTVQTNVVGMQTCSCARMLISNQNAACTVKTGYFGWFLQLLLFRLDLRIHAYCLATISIILSIRCYKTTVCADMLTMCHATVHSMMIALCGNFLLMKYNTIKRGRLFIIKMLG